MKEKGFMREETDSFGPIPVSAEAYWGAQTERSRQNFRIGVEIMPLPVIRSLGLQTKGYQVVESDGKELVKNAIANQPDIIILNSIFSGKQEIVKTLRFEKGLENVLFFIYQ